MFGSVIKMGKNLISNRGALSFLAYVTLFIISFYYLNDTFGYLFPDSPSYINNSIFVTPLYPLFIDFLQAIFGEDNFRSITIVQYILGYLMLCWGCVVISKTLKLMLAIELQFFVFLLMFYIQIKSNLLHFSYASSIITEAICYPLFFLVLGYFVKFVVERQRKQLLLLLFLISVLFAIRAQFAVLYGVLFLFIFFGLFKEPRLKPVYLVFTVLAFLLAQYSTNFYNQYRYGKFIGAQGLGVSFSNTVFYLIEREDRELFKDTTTRKVFDSIYNSSLAHNSIRRCDKEKWIKPEYSEIKKVYKGFPNWNLQAAHLAMKEHDLNYNNTIALNNIVFDKEGRCSNNDLIHFFDTKHIRILNLLDGFGSNGIYNLEDMNSILMDMTFKLIRQHFLDWFLICIQMFFTYMWWFFMLITLPVFFYQFFTFKYSEPRPFKSFFLILLAIYISNALFISFVGVYNLRYTIYTYTPLLGAWILFLQKIFKSKGSRE